MQQLCIGCNDMKTGKAVEKGEVKVKVQDPGKAEQTRDLQGMHGHFGSDFDLAKKGKYGVMCKLKLLMARCGALSSGMR